MSRRPRWRLRAFLKWTLYVFLGIAIVYLVAINVFLRTRLFRNLVSSNPESLRVEYASAYSILPGRIHAEGLEIRGRDHNVEWVVALDRVDFRVSFLELAKKTFHATHVRGDGLSLHLRRRQDSFTPAVESALPPVPGFPDPPRAEPGPPSPPIRDEDYDLFTIRLDDVVASHVREVWVDTVRYSGDYDVHGRWLFRPERWLEVGPAHVDVRELDVGFGKIEPWVSSAHGQFTVTMHGYDVRSRKGAEILDQITLEGDARGTARTDKFLTRVLAPHGVVVARGEAPFDAHIEVDHGVVQRGTRARTERFRAEVRAEDLDFAAETSGVASADDGGRAEITVAGLRVVHAGLEAARAAKTVVVLRTRELDAARPFGDTTYALDVSGAATDAADYWRTRFPPGPVRSITASGATGDAHVEGTIAKRDLRGRAHLDADNVAVLFDDAAVDARVSAAVHVDGSLPEKRLDLSHTEVLLQDVRARIQGLRSFARSIDARASGLLVGHGGVVGHVAFEAPDVEVPSLAPLGPLFHWPDSVAVEQGGGHARVAMDVDVARRVAKGTIDAHARGLRFRIGSGTVTGDMTVALRAAPRGDVTDLSGTTVSFADPGWRATVQCARAELGARGGARFRASLAAHVTDGAPFAALAAKPSPVPEWVTKAIASDPFDGSGELVVAPSVVEARSVKARGDRLAVDFALAKHAQDLRWALLLSSGPLSAALDRTNGQTAVHLIGAQSWFSATAASIQGTR